MFMKKENVYYKLTLFAGLLTVIACLVAMTMSFRAKDALDRLKNRYRRDFEALSLQIANLSREIERINDTERLLPVRPTGSQEGKRPILSNLLRGIILKASCSSGDRGAGPVGSRYRK